MAAFGYLRFMQVVYETKQNNYYGQISVGSDYLNIINRVAIYTPETEAENITILDIKKDSTFKILVKTTNSMVQNFLALVSGHSLFVGGTYYLKDGSADVRNIGMYDLREKKWYDLAGGVCGPVYILKEMNGSIYVGGEFSTAGKK